MEVISISPFRTGSVLWRPRPDRWTLTVVCKGTYALGPGESGLASEQEEVLTHDRYWEDDPRRSVYAPSDLAPFKPRADVMLVGNAFAPGSEVARSLVVRLIVGEMEKAVEVFCPRVITRDGELREGPRWSKMPLRYEFAAGGLDTWNPVGVSPAAVPDQYGQRPLPSLQPPELRVAQWGDIFVPVGFGPIASTWRLRREKLGRRAEGWSDDGWPQIPLDDDFDGEFFQAAPPDQQIESIREGESIILEYLHPDHPRLTTALAGVHPHAFVEVPGAPAHDLVMTADTLWIDTDRSLCTVTWRGQVAVDGPSQAGRVLIAVEEPGQRLTWANIASLAGAPIGSTGSGDPSVGRRSLLTLPFHPPETPPTPVPPRPSGPRKTLPMGAPDPPATPPALEPAWLAPNRTPSDLPPATTPMESPTNLSARIDPAVLAAARVAMDDAGSALEVLHRAPALGPRLRKDPAWATLLGPMATEGPEGADADVDRVLSRGTPGRADLEAALFDGVAEGAPLAPRLLLLAGEIELLLDTVEVLRAMLAAASPMARADPRLREVLDFGEEMIKADLQGSPDAIEWLRTNVRETWMEVNRGLPANYLDAHAERMLLEQRRYQRRELLDDTWIRALFSPTGGGARVPAYLPAAVSRRLPIFHRFPARLLAEVVPQQDQYETQPVALRVAALARVVVRAR
jgi:hypothetical protein